MFRPSLPPALRSGWLVIILYTILRNSMTMSGSLKPSVDNCGGASCLCLVTLSRRTPWLAAEEEPLRVVVDNLVQNIDTSHPEYFSS